MKVRLVQIDGKLPNLALMKLAAWHRERGDEVQFTKDIEHGGLFEEKWDRIYGSAIFSRSADRVARFKTSFPEAIVGGTYNTADNRTVEQLISEPEYEHYDYRADGMAPFDGSIGFTQRGCRLNCGFCVVPKKEGKPRSINRIVDIWRGKMTAAELCEARQRRDQLAASPEAEPHELKILDEMLSTGNWPKHLHLLDNDFFGQPREQWQARVREIVDGGFKPCLNQGINTRMIDQESAEAIRTMGYWDDSFKYRRLYTAWDNLGDEERFFRGVDTLERAGIPASHLTVYMLIGFDKRETWERLFYRLKRMLDRRISPYPMVYGDRKRTLPTDGLKATRVRDRYVVIEDPNDPRLQKRTLEQFQRYVIKRYFTVPDLPFEAFQYTEWKRRQAQTVSNAA